MCSMVGYDRRVSVEAKPFAFVLMPFEQAFDDVYNLGIKAAAADANIVAERVDEQIYTESILERIYRQIKTSDFIVADMTGRNPNVFYEVGYAHALGKLCTLITKSADDLKHHRHIVYEGSIAALKHKLITEFEWLKLERQKRTSNPFSLDLKSPWGHVEKNDYSARSRVSFTFDIHNRTEKKSPDIDAIYIYTGPGWTMEQDKIICPHTSEDGDNTSRRHFIKCPVSRLAPGAWTQITLDASKLVWIKSSGDEYQSKYSHAGVLRFAISTVEGVYETEFNLNVESEELPF